MLVFGIPAAIKQHRHWPILNGLMNAFTSIGCGRYCGADPRRSRCREHYGENKISRAFRQFSVHGVAVWAAIVVSIGMRRPDWEVLPRSLRSSIFLLSLVLIGR